jgi:hypothetical protein
MAPALKVSPAASTQLMPCFCILCASFAMAVVFPPPFMPTNISTKGGGLAFMSAVRSSDRCASTSRTAALSANRIA